MAKFLLGFMGAGKSTLARLLDADFVDMDALLVEKLGMPITEYFEKYGEAAFRQEETALLKDLLAEKTWISTGGGIVMRAENRELLKQGDACIYLKADFETLYERIAKDSTNERPLFLKNSKESLRAIYLERQAWYEEVATRILEVEGKSPEELAEVLR
ncbi:shikimate kinase [Streptococcus pneumoniae]